MTHVVFVLAAVVGPCSGGRWIFDGAGARDRGAFVGHEQGEHFGERIRWFSAPRRTRAPSDMAREAASDIYACIANRSCTREDLAAVTARFPPGSPGAALYIVNKFASMANKFFGDDVVNDLLEVARDHPELLGETSDAAHRAFQNLESEALHRHEYKERLTNFLAKVPPDVRTVLSIDASMLRGLDQRAAEVARAAVRTPRVAAATAARQPRFAPRLSFRRKGGFSRGEQHGGPAWQASVAGRPSAR